MFTTIKRHGWLTSTLRLVPVFAIVAAAMIAMAPGDARAAFDEKSFSCTTTPFGVAFDFSGLGHTNLCLQGSVTLDLDCACAGGGGNCTSDAKKNTFTTTSSSSLSVEPKNGRASGTFQLPISVSDGLCAALDCPSGQTEKLVDFTATDGGATFTICATTAPAGGSCTCDLPAQGDLPDSRTCGPISGTPFPGKHNSCSNLFP
jgi:hypothetical protein